MKQLIGIIAIVGFLAGCAPSPTARWVQASDALNAARDTTSVLYEQKVLTAEEFVKTKPVEASARAALNVAETQLPEGTDTFEKYLAVAKAGLLKLAETYEGKVK